MMHQGAVIVVLFAEVGIIIGQLAIIFHYVTLLTLEIKLPAKQETIFTKIFKQLIP